MSCWVVPSVAAEIWGVSVDTILARINSGQLPTKNDLGRIFVDVAPHSPVFQTPNTRSTARPATFRLASPEPIEAATAHPTAAAEPPATPLVQTCDTDADAYQDEQTINLGDWREARQSAGARRQPPTAIAA
ncbi:hypothetical protein [Fontivita pretiosa]|uniref:hypothetical protein n=1 Tax=Fontivita pretiosa TaxID=2989684 RepID=UPI003D164721